MLMVIVQGGILVADGVYFVKEERQQDKVVVEVLQEVVICLLE